MFRILTFLAFVLVLVAAGCSKKEVAQNDKETKSNSGDTDGNKEQKSDKDSDTNGTSSKTNADKKQMPPKKEMPPKQMPKKEMDPKKDMSESVKKNAGDNQTNGKPLYDGPFLDEVKSNSKPPKTVSELKFKDKNGKVISVADYMGKRNLLIVFTKGFSGMICPYCKTQTSRLIANYKKFSELDTEVIVVFPGKADKLDEFMKAALKTEKEEVDSVPFPIVLDENFVATDFFDIRGSLAEPSTFILDKQGKVQLAYVAQKNNTTDRPSVSAMLKKLKQVNQ